MADTVADTQTPNSSLEEDNNESSGMSLSRIAMIIIIVIIIVILLPLILALIAALTASETWLPVIQILRNIMEVIFVIEGILVIGAIAILIVQISRFVTMLNVEIKPILDNARETTKATKATAQFVSKNTADPLIRIKAFFAGLTTFIREILRIRRLINPKKSSDSKDNSGK